MTQSVSQILADGTAKLQAAGISAAKSDAQRLLASVLSDEQQITFVANDRVGDQQTRKYEAYIDRRVKRQPVSQIVGKRWFFDHEFEINSFVLDPRPESEILVTEVLSKEPSTILDLGSGSGCLLLSILSQLCHSTGLGIDRCPHTLRVARRNAQRLGCGRRAAFRLGNWLEGIDQKFACIVINPPYIPDGDIKHLAPEITQWEPRHALTDGGDGLGAFREIARHAADCLLPEGFLVTEIGPNQLHPVADIFRENGLLLDDVIFDLDCRPRALSFQPNRAVAKSAPSCLKGITWP
ncbi:MAG: peptide chain release factor N(5)-glutamine methyltransferase [Rhodobacteraceae bacterium]|nr:peptide chain release factor N(5)-glutamine methyltransferase [Paracoccaceae bacterium]